MWFQELTGFDESVNNVRNKLKIVDNAFVSLAHNKKFEFGKLEIPTLEELRSNNQHLEKYNGKIRLSEVIANVLDLHAAQENSNALFQVASQFNLLEMVNPNITPEMGVDRYELDLTQGPMCAIACGAGTIYRNYFVQVGNQIGQTADCQINCLDLIGEDLDNEGLKLWEMRNGYALLNQKGINNINSMLENMTDKEREEFKGKLKVGIQWQTEVTISETKHKVSQVYCSALPVAYSKVDSRSCEAFARIILEALYEATFYAAMMNMEKYNSNKVYLTLVGGGAFGNDGRWILDSVYKIVHKFRKVPLDVIFVSYNGPNMYLRQYFNDIVQTNI